MREKCTYLDAGRERRKEGESESNGGG